MIRVAGKMDPVFLFLFSVVIGLTSHAQANEESAPVPVAKCTTEQSPWSDFDFWVGQWEVFDPNTGNKVGDNRIEKRENGCLILEDWKSLSGSSGISMNFYDPLQDQWRQVWQSAGVFIDYSGGLDDQGRMLLQGRIHYHSSGQTAPFRGRWTLQEDGSVLQEFWQLDETADSWNSWFVGVYRKAELKH